MKLVELSDEFRRQVSDEEEPYLWGDDEVRDYIVDAQDMFVRRTGGIADASTPDIVDLALETDEPFTAHSPYILRIRSGRLQTAARDVTFIQESDLGLASTRDYGWSYGLSLDDTQTGPVRFGVLGVEDYKVRWLQVPATDDVCRLNVLRLPYPRIVDLEGDVELEIPEHHHRHLLLWMKHLAYSKQDAETRNDKVAETNRLAFEDYCVRAASELQRVRYRPRVVQYGGL